MVASALPPAATLDVPVYVLHMLSATTHDGLSRRLLDNAQQSAAAALHRCHRALELDGAAHSYTATSGCRSPATAPPSSSSQPA